MQLKHLLIFNAVIGVLFGIGFVAAPAQSLAAYGVTLGEQGLGITRLMGAAFIGIGLLAWGARNDPGSPALRGIVLGLLIGAGIGFVVSVVNQLAGLANNLGWSTVANYLIFTLGYAYFQFIKPIRN